MDEWIKECCFLRIGRSEKGHPNLGSNSYLFPTCYWKWRRLCAPSCVALLGSYIEQCIFFQKQRLVDQSAPQAGHRDWSSQWEDSLSGPRRVHRTRGPRTALCAFNQRAAQEGDRVERAKERVTPVASPAGASWTVPFTFFFPFLVPGAQCWDLTSVADAHWDPRYGMTLFFSGWVLPAPRWEVRFRESFERAHPVWGTRKGMRTPGPKPKRSCQEPRSGERRRLAGVGAGGDRRGKPPSAAIDAEVTCWSGEPGTGVRTSIGSPLRVET